MERADRYHKAIRRTRIVSKRLQVALRWMSLFRLLSFSAIFLLPALLFYFFSDGINNFTVILSALPGTVFFVLSVFRFFELNDRIRKLTAQTEHYRISLRLQEKGWHEDVPWSDPPIVHPAHPYRDDLDLTGNGSLLHYLDRTTTPVGRKRLIELLENQPDPTALDPERWQMRRDTIRLLSKKSVFFFRFLREGVALRLTSPDFQEFEWTKTVMEEPLPKLPTPLLIAPLVTALFTWFTFALFLLELTPPYFLLSLPLHAVFFPVMFRLASPHAARYAKRAFQLSSLENLIRIVERHTGDLLFSRYQIATEKPARKIARLARTAGLFEIRSNPALYFLFGFLFLHEFFLVAHLKAWLEQNRDSVHRWFEEVGEIDAFLSFARYGYDNPRLSLPELHTKPELFIAEGLAHPLLSPAQRIGNDFQLNGIGIVTGSNMAGKSTFLRTAGVNLLLAMIGSTVCASSYTFRPAKIFTSMRHADSTRDSVSYFYDEVRRIAAILRDARESKDLLFVLIDELLRGTNERERTIAVRSIVHELGDARCSGFVATHDLSLTDLCKESEQFECIHFEQTIENGIMSFDYRLKQGPVRTSNALEILRMEGIPIRSPGIDLN